MGYFAGMQDNRTGYKYSLNCKGRLVTMQQPLIMGIINITPDSFHAQSRKQSQEEVLATAEQYLEEGATILDMGGQSTRPGSKDVGANTETERVVELIGIVAQRFPEAIISVDTYHASVAQTAVEAGASIVNDISGGLLDSAMITTVAQLGVPYICTHLQGTPTNMQENPSYENVVAEVFKSLAQRLEACVLAGINDVVIDVGFGFGKTIAHNYELLRELAYFQLLNHPILVGVSRKGMIYKPLNITAAEALNGTTALHTIALLNGANMLRVHDVKAAKEAIELVQLYFGE